MIRRLGSAPHALDWMLGGQVLLALIILFVPFGFDHASSWGLLPLALYPIVLFAGLIEASKRRKWLLFTLQIAAPCAILALEVAGVLSF